MAIVNISGEEYKARDFLLFEKNLLAKNKFLIDSSSKFLKVRKGPISKFSKNCLNQETRRHDRLGFWFQLPRGILRSRMF